MLKYVADIFQNSFKDKIDNAILDNYVLDEGDYIIVRETEDGLVADEPITIKYEKKNKVVDKTIANYDFLCEADYLSKLIDINKPIDGKKIIHSNNYLSFFIKKDSLASRKLTDEIIYNYYNVLREPRTKYKNKKLEIYEEVESRLGKSDKEKIGKIENWILENVWNMISKNSKEKTYLKIFFKDNISQYKKESEKYILPNIYNNNDYNIKSNAITLGLPNNNMGMNAKKPYFENKTRKIKVPFLLSTEEVLMQKKLFDYLMNNANMGCVNIYINEEGIKAISNKESLKEDFSGIYMRIKKGKEVEILDFDTVEKYTYDDKKPLKIRNVLEMNIDKLTENRLQYENISCIEKIKKVIDNTLFSKFLDGNYFTESKDLNISNENLKRNLLLCRTNLFSWFYKGNKLGVWKNLNESSLSLIKGCINKGYLQRACEQFNLRCALKEYFEGGEEMPDILKQIKDDLRKKINIKIDQKTESIENDKEYYFAVGQLTSYFIFLNKSMRKTHSLANPVINARNNDRIKEQLMRLYKKYNYDINYSGNRFKNLYAMVKSYEPKTKVDNDLILAGYLHSNLILEKSEKNEEGGEN